MENIQKKINKKRVNEMVEEECRSKGNIWNSTAETNYTYIENLIIPFRVHINIQYPSG